MQNLIKTNETGRSMVEMLGVLAIIGVLSVTGVAGYKAAVRKALANNLLNQASMRATDVATKIGSGNLEDLTNDAFDNDLGGGVTISNTVKGPDGYTDYARSDEQFTLTLEGLDEELCQQMQSMAGGSRSVVREVECVNNEDGDLIAILTFNKDLSANDKPESEGNEGIPETSPCPTGTSTEGAGGYATTLADNSMCYCETSGTVYKEGTCESKGDDNTCSSYADCDKGEYCQFPQVAPPSTSGVCQSVSGCGLYDIDISDGKKYTGSDHGGSCIPNWWTANDVCASLNMRMVSLSDLGCEGSLVYEPCPTDGTVYGALRFEFGHTLWTADVYDSYSAYYVENGMRNISADARASYDFLCVR